LVETDHASDHRAAAYIRRGGATRQGPYRRVTYFDTMQSIGEPSPRKWVRTQL